MQNPGVWIATIIIVVAGAVVLFTMGSGDRNRSSDLDGTVVGEPASAVAARLGVEPTECPVGDLRHLSESFGAGWSPASVDVALESLATQTHSRRIYPIGSRTPACDGSVHQTEIGVDAAGNVVWWIAVVGRTPLQLPPTVTPAGVDTIALPAA